MSSKKASSPSWSYGGTTSMLPFTFHSSVSIELKPSFSMLSTMTSV